MDAFPKGLRAVGVGEGLLGHGNRRNETVESTRAAFASMSQREFDAMMDSSRFGMFLTPTEQEGLKLAIGDRIQRKTESVARWCYIVFEVDRAGTEHEFARCSDPFTASRVQDDLHRRLGRWGVALVRRDDQDGDESYHEDEECEMFLETLSDENYAAFVGKVGVVYAGDRDISSFDFYHRFYGSES